MNRRGFICIAAILVLALAPASGFAQLDVELGKKTLQELAEARAEVERLRETIKKFDPLNIQGMKALLSEKDKELADLRAELAKYKSDDIPAISGAWVYGHLPCSIGVLDKKTGTVEVKFPSNSRQWHGATKRAHWNESAQSLCILSDDGKTTVETWVLRDGKLWHSLEETTYWVR